MTAQDTQTYLGSLIKIYNGTNTKMNLSIQQFDYDIEQLALCFAAIVHYSGDTYINYIEFNTDNLLDAYKDGIVNLLEELELTADYEYDETLSSGSICLPKIWAHEFQNDSDEYYPSIEQAFKFLAEKHPKYRLQLNNAYINYRKAVNSL